MTMLNLSSELIITKNAKSDCNIKKSYLGQWCSTNHKICLYTQDNKIWAVVKDMFGEVMILPNKHIKGGINGIITQDNLLKMIKCNHDRIEITLHQNRNNQLTLWVIPKLEAAGRADEILIKKAKECEKQAKEYAKLFKMFHDTDNFDSACVKYQETLNFYKRAYNVKDRNAENTEQIKNVLSKLRKEFFLFKLNQKMDTYLAEPKDRREVNEIFDLFIDEEDVFTLTLEVIESTSQEKRSKAENLACAYSAEFLKNYTLAIKSYLLLSRQNYDYENQNQNDNKNQTYYSGNCLKKAESLIEEAKQTSNYFNIADFLKEVGAEWLLDTIQYIPGCDYFIHLVEDNQLETMANTFKKKKLEKAIETYKNNPNEETFNNICNEYKEAIYYLNVLPESLKSNNKNTLNELQKEFFEFKLDSIMNLYLPSAADQSKFRNSLDLHEYNFSFMLEVIKRNPEEKRSHIDNFTCAYIYEFLGDPISSSQHYLTLSKQYFQNDNPVSSATCLKKAESLIREKATTSNDPFPISNFLEMLDRKWINRLNDQLYELNDNAINDVKRVLNNDLKRVLLEKDAVRMTFQESLNKIRNHANNIEPNCFICFNVEEPDVQDWLSNTLVPDLERVGVKTIFALNSLKIGADLNNFQSQIRNTDFVIIACTPGLKEKCIRRTKAPAGSTLEIKLALERFKDYDKYETTFLIYLKGDHQSSCPSAFLEPFFGKKLNIDGKNSDFNYYASSLNFFAHMRKVKQGQFQKIEYTFKYQIEAILLKNEIDKDRIELWRNSLR